MAQEHKLIQSYVLNQWFVSTAYRQSSAAIESPPWYYETIIWEWDSATMKRGDIINVLDGAYGYKAALKKHFGVCQRLAKSHFKN
jgi:hypothetical protein